MKRAVALSSLLLGLLIAGAATGQGTPPPSDPQLTFEDSAVVASGLTPGKAVAWFGVEHRIDPGYSGEMIQRYDVGTAAADGTARLELPQPLAPRSFWVAVDLESGGFAVAAPGGYRLAKPLHPSRLRALEGAASDEILDDRPYLMGLVVRPGGGAWAFAGGDGGPRDEDGASDGHLRFALDKLDPLLGSPAAPARSQKADLWFIVAPLTMEISVHKGGVAQ
ncbi:MAG TPA: hypothetical protein VLB76_09315 [Thermoanaerobaculia bacterium]|jgi:hypothetical protein|nr:hypothetical protein [Thermoanaerobaculia bacterium]